MLSATRVIGHKEYAAGRKSDPVYDMNWRRARVASFVPRSGGTTITSEDLLAAIKVAVIIGSPSSGPHKDKVLAFYLVSGKVRHLTSPLIVTKTKERLKAYGIPFQEVGEIDLPEAFGDMADLDD